MLKVDCPTLMLSILIMVRQVHLRFPKAHNYEVSEDIMGYRKLACSLHGQRGPLCPSVIHFKSIKVPNFLKTAEQLYQIGRS